MAQITDKSAREKVVRARTNLLVSSGFFGFLAMQLRLTEATEINGQPINTMGVDGVTIYYNPTFVHLLNERETEGVVAHEVMHCCFKHFTRRQNRDPLIWNIAGDFVINNDLVASGFSLPGQPLALADLGNPKFKGVKIYLLDPSLEGMTTEEIYDKIYQAATKIKITIQFGDGNDPGMCGGVMDAPGGSSGEEATSQTWDITVRAALAVAKANGAGNLPASMKRLLADLEKPKVSWRDQTRNFIDQSLTKDVTWSRPSRRSVATGTLMPGYISDRLSHMVFIADTSGSISNDLLTAFLSEVAGALDQGTADRMTVLYADTRVHDVDEFIPGDLVKVSSLDKGGGGTDFRNSFEWIKEHAPDASCVVYLTDLITSDFGEDPGCPVLWAVYGPTPVYDQVSGNVPFGQCIHISDTYG